MEQSSGVDESRAEECRGGEDGRRSTHLCDHHLGQTRAEATPEEAAEPAGRGEPANKVKACPVVEG